MIFSKLSSPPYFMRLSIQADVLNRVEFNTTSLKEDSTLLRNWDLVPKSGFSSKFAFSAEQNFAENGLRQKGSEHPSILYAAIDY